MDFLEQTGGRASCSDGPPFQRESLSICPPDARAACANPDTISSWFSRVEEFFKVVGFIKSGKVVDDFAYRLWNCDESGFCLGLTSKKILARKGSRAVHEVGGSSDHQYITVNICGSAAGARLPAFICTKGKTCTIPGRMGDQLVPAMA